MLVHSEALGRALIYPSSSPCKLVYVHLSFRNYSVIDINNCFMTIKQNVQKRTISSYCIFSELANYTSTKTLRNN